MTIEELSQDKAFLEGLRSGDYCLVLGAGFSYELKNKTSVYSLNKINRIKYDDFKNIPLVKAYVDLTNKIFAEETTKGEAAANIWESEKFSINENNEHIELKTFYQNLFTLDEDWFKENKMVIYKNILIPNWYHVYTFNFDNVFEIIVKLKNRTDFYSLHFPEHSGILKTNNKAIVHLHGFISKTSPESITFSDSTYNTLRDTKHTLYDQFYSDVDAGKKLFIIGTQFDEKVIDEKFFSGIENKNITIYHFDRSNANFKTKPGIANNPNYHFIRIETTTDVLDFIERYKFQIENIEIAGAITINPDFINKVKEDGNREGFKASDFYLAKQVDLCQWYGITQNWMVERENYDPIKAEIVSSFADKNRNAKISTLIWGKGGSGKSTLLRKLAIDLSKEDFTVLWIQDITIQKFFADGLMHIKDCYQHKHFLIVIEDIYRVKQQQGIKLNEIIEGICSEKNFRLIIGDRRDDDDSYKAHIYNPEKNIVELTVGSNKITINRLLENIPEWKDAATSLLTSDSDYQSSLYYILWTIGRTAQKSSEGISIVKYHDFISHFRSLVESDLKALTGSYYRQDNGTTIFNQYYYPGIAKMLFYWASVYASNKIYISYDLFFKLADIFRNSSSDESKMILASPTYNSILNIYIHKSEGIIKSAGSLPLLAFNHDILAEDGLSKVRIRDWHQYDDSINLKMLPLIIKEGDNFSASNFLSHCLRHIPNARFSKDEKKKWTYELRQKGNFNSYLVAALTLDFYSEKEKVGLAYEILEQKRFWNLDKSIICTALNITKDKAKADEILKQENFWNLPFDIVSIALNITKDKAKADEILKQENFWNLDKGIICTALNITKDKAKADEILKQENFWNLPFQIISNALNITKDKAKADEILKQENFWNLPFQIISNALNITKDKAKADEILKQENFWNLDKEIICNALNITKDKAKADEILKQENFWNLPFDIVSIALNITKDKAKADEILKQENFWNLDKSIICTALNITKDKAKADEILKQENFWNLPFDIVCTALNITKDKAKADEILELKNFWNLPTSVVSTSLNFSDNGDLKEKVSEILFTSGQWKEKWSITYHILGYYSGKQKMTKQIKEIIKIVISDFFDKKISEKGKFIRYVNLMKIPFFSVPLWDKTSLENIQSWENHPRNLVANTILAYRSKPILIKNICKLILNNWQNEITKPILMIGSRGTHYGDHIRLSLGHPDLKQLAKQTALKIKMAETKSPSLIPEHLMIIVNQIVDEKKFPVWNSRSENL